jgi:hypothetical protein
MRRAKICDMYGGKDKSINGLEDNMKKGHHKEDLGADSDIIKMDL